MKKIEMRFIKIPLFSIQAPSNKSPTSCFRITASKVVWVDDREMRDRHMGKPVLIINWGWGS